MTRALTWWMAMGAVGAAALVGCSSDEEEGSTDVSVGSGGGAADAGAGGAAASAATSSGGASASGGSAAASSGGAAGAAGGGAASGGSSAYGGTGGDSWTPCAQLAALDDCGWQAVRAEFRPVQILVIMDKSASMEEDMGGGLAGSRWDAIRFSVVHAMRPLEQFVSVGLDVFPEVDNHLSGYDQATPEEWCSMPEADGSVIVPIGPATETLDEMSLLLNGDSTVDPAVPPEITPGGATPMADALRRAYSYFLTIMPVEGTPGDMYVLLATDGGPNCNGDLSCGADTCVLNMEGQISRCTPDYNCCEPPPPTGGGPAPDPQPHSCLDHEAVLEQIDALATLGVNTIVVGIPGSEPFADYLDQFAVAGGQPDPNGERDYYEVAAGATQQGLEQILQDITMDLIHDCTIMLQEPPDNISLVNVAVDCQVVTKDLDDDNSGWHYDDPSSPTAIILDGDICQQIIEEGAQQVDIVQGCSTIR